jgi:hypothetical protein
MWHKPIELMVYICPGLVFAAGFGYGDLGRSRPDPKKIIHPKKFNGDLIRKIEKASRSCPVKRSLNQDIEVQTEFLTE